MSQRSTTSSSCQPSRASAKRYPFVAVVGQQQLKRALILATIDPHLGGVLIQGPRGIAKTTLSRGLADLLPGKSSSHGRPAFVELPLGTTVDRLTGSIDLQQVLKNQDVAFTPGLLYKAHEGVLYIDEVNLLDDTLIDILLDVAAHGVNRVERDGVSHEHPARCVLIGTMNPDEGELRPQLSDRFGLSVMLESHLSVDERLDVVQQRMDFDADPEGFISRHDAETHHLKGRIGAARLRLSTISISNALKREIAHRAIHAGVEGVRADIAWRRAALAHAAFEGRNEVEVVDIDAVEPLVLGHRTDYLPPSSTDGDNSAQKMPPVDHGPGAESTSDASPSECSSGNGGHGNEPATNAHHGEREPRSKTQSSLLSPSRRTATRGNPSQRQDNQRTSQRHAPDPKSGSSQTGGPAYAGSRSELAINTKQAINATQTVTTGNTRDAIRAANSAQTLASQHENSAQQEPPYAEAESFPAAFSSSADSAYSGHNDRLESSSEYGTQQSQNGKGTGTDTGASPVVSGKIQLREPSATAFGYHQRPEHQRSKPSNGQITAPTSAPLHNLSQRLQRAKHSAQPGAQKVQTQHVDWFATLSDHKNHNFKAKKAKENVPASDISINRFSYRKRPMRMPVMTLVMLDISASTLSRAAIDLAAQAVLRIADEARHLGHQFALLVFGMGGCRWICRARRVPAALRTYLKQLKVGGGTPLAEALHLGRQFLHQRQLQCAGMESHCWLLTDGRTQTVTQVPRWPSHLNVIDTEQGRVRLGRASIWARQLGAHCCSLAHFMASPPASFHAG